jgi:hypothetical protein
LSLGWCLPPNWREERQIFLLSWVDQLLLLVLERPDCVEPSGSAGWRGVARVAPACNAPAAHQQATPQFRYVWLVLLAVPRGARLSAAAASAEFDQLTL